jgi:SAM-dependent methyltransferase
LTEPGATSANLKRSVVSHYEARLREHGATARGMDWKDEESQRLRFSVLCEVAELSGRSVYDVGAGAAHLCTYLQQEHSTAVYAGCDLSPEMIEAARRLHPDADIEVRDILLDPPSHRYDLVVCSGAFHVKLAAADPEWREYMYDVIRRMYAMCDVAIAFNLMTDQVDYRAEGLFYAHPGEIFDFCRNELSRYVTLRNDYPLYEFTTYVYR